jgi:hypothetical protein
MQPRATRTERQVAIDNLVKGAGGQAIQAMNRPGHRRRGPAGRRDLSMLNVVT